MRSRRRRVPSPVGLALFLQEDPNPEPIEWEETTTSVGCSTGTQQRCPLFGLLPRHGPEA